MRTYPAKLAAALAAVLPILAVCVVSMAHAAPGRGPEASASIIHGQLAPPGKFPYMAFVVDFINPTEAAACTGTVLSPTIVLTAGHCVVDEHTGETEPAEGFRVVTGTTNWAIEEGRQLSHVVKAIPYPKFVPGTARDGYGDAALLVLETPTTAPAIQIATPANRNLMRIGQRALIAGWGMRVFGEKTFDENLIWARTVVESDRCEGLWGRICAIDFPAGRSGVCHGDSGGPLLAHRKHGTGYVEIAIVEAGFGKCTTRRPQIFTRTDLIAGWIRKTMAKNEAPVVPAAP